MGTLIDIIKKYNRLNESGYRMKPKIDDLYRMLDEIIGSKSLEIEERIYILPFFYYWNKEGFTQFEYDEGVFFIKKGEKMSESIYQEYLIPIEPVTKLFIPVPVEQKKILTPNNAETSQEFIERVKGYREYLPALISMLYEDCVKRANLNTDEKKAFGYFSFEVHGR